MQKTKTLKEAIDELIKWEVHFGRSGQNKENSMELRKQYLDIANSMHNHVNELKKIVENNTDVHKVV